MAATAQNKFETNWQRSVLPSRKALSKFGVFWMSIKLSRTEVYFDFGNKLDAWDECDQIWQTFTTLAKFSTVWHIWKDYLVFWILLLEKLSWHLKKNYWCKWPNVEKLLSYLVTLDEAKIFPWHLLTCFWSQFQQRPQLINPSQRLITTSWGNHKWIIARWFCLHLQSCGSGFESQAHYILFFQFVLLKLKWELILEWEQDETKRKRGRDWPIFKKT